MLNFDLFARTAAQWRPTNPDHTGNMRNTTTLEQLVVLSNLESGNSLRIHQGLPPQERRAQLNAIVINPMRSLLGSVSLRRLLGAGRQQGI